MFWTTNENFDYDGWSTSRLPFCEVSSFANFRSIQKSSTQATFWHDPLNENIYKRKNTYMADINNDMFVNETYIKKLQSLKKFVMIKCERETIC